MLIIRNRFRAIKRLSAIQIPKYTGALPLYLCTVLRQDADSVYLPVETKAENM